MGLLLRLAERTDKFKILNINIDVKICVSKKVEPLEKRRLIHSAFGNIANAKRYVSVYVFRWIYRYF